MDHQSVTLAIWLGVAVLALLWATFGLWHTRRNLRQVRLDDSMTQTRLAPASVAPPTHSVVS